jgi:hypothetical protein
VQATAVRIILSKDVSFEHNKKEANFARTGPDHIRNLVVYNKPAIPWPRGNAD